MEHADTPQHAAFPVLLQAQPGRRGRGSRERQPERCNPHCAAG